jgi:hypothetical protein
MAAGRLDPDPARHTRLQIELTQFAAEKLTPGRSVATQISTADGGAKPLDQPAKTGVRVPTERQ